MLYTARSLVGKGPRPKFVDETAQEELDGGGEEEEREKEKKEKEKEEEEKEKIQLAKELEDVGLDDLDEGSVRI